MEIYIYSGNSVMEKKGALSRRKTIDSEKRSILINRENHEVQRDTRHCSHSAHSRPALVKQPRTAILCLLFAQCDGATLRL